MERASDGTLWSKAKSAAAVGAGLCALGGAVGFAAPIIAPEVFSGVAGTVGTLGAMFGLGSAAAVEVVEYHRERLRLVDDPMRLHVTGMASVWGEDIMADTEIQPWPEYPRPGGSSDAFGGR